MEYFIFLNPEHEPGDDPRARLDGHVRQVVAAQELGFSGVAVGQHLSTEGFQWFPPIPLLSYLASAAPGMRFGTSILALPFFHPVLVAEAMAFIDVATNGRSFFGAASGWSESEFKTLGIERSRRRTRLVEGLEIVRRLWTEDGVTFAGKEYQLDNVTLSLRPIQKPRPPIWMGASTEKMAREAAAISDALVYSSHPPLSVLETLSHAYNDERTKLGLGPPAEVPVLRNCFVGETYDEAVATALPYLQASYAGFFSDHIDGVLRIEKQDDALLDRVILGGPQDVIDGIRRVREKLGATAIVFRMQWQGMPDTLVDRAIRILGEQVLPHVD